MSGIRQDNMQDNFPYRGDEFRTPSAAPGQHDRPRISVSGQGDEGSPISMSMKVPKEQVHRFASFGVGLAGIFAEHVLSHPCIVLRRQCQVHTTATWFHTTPFTLLPVIFNIQRNQTMTTLWKGIGSVLTIKGMTVLAETVLSEFTPLPKEANRHSSMKKLMEHLLLKGLSIAAVTPFYAASLVETVQSEIASERPGVFDCLWEGGNRLLGWNSSQTTRLLPVWSLLLPNVVHGISHYTITSLAQYTVLVSIKSEMQENKDQLTSAEALERTLYEASYAQLIATFTGNLLADMMLYPLETVLHRLCLQGTRTIIDNTDTGVGVMPIMTRYESVYDCFCGIMREEGIMGLYKGFGALILQYTLHVAVLKLTKFVFEQLAHRLPGKGGGVVGGKPGLGARGMMQQQGRVPGSTTGAYPQQYYPQSPASSGGYASSSQNYTSYQHQTPPSSYYSQSSQRAPPQPYSPAHH